MGRSLREAADRSPSGVLPPAGTEPGNQARSAASGRCAVDMVERRVESVSYSRQPAGTGPGSWANSCTNKMTAASTTTISERYPWRSGRLEAFRRRQHTTGAGQGELHPRVIPQHLRYGLEDF